MRKYRRCPKCKSKKGFLINYVIHGYGHEIRSFEGEVLDADRNVYDDTENWASCINCGENIDSNKLEI